MSSKQRTALVTGGSGGIGLEVVRCLAAEGYFVTFFDADGERLAKAKHELSVRGANIWGRQVDMCDAAQVAAGVRELEAERGTVDILVNNVGGSTIRAPADEMADNVFDEILDLNLRTVFLCTKAVVPRMKKQRWGRIVNVTSVAGRSHALSTNSNAAYVAAKAGVIGFTRQCAAEFAPFGIAVNAVAPGPIATARVLAGWEARSAESQEELLNRIPAGRFGEPQEAAAAICYLCSEHAGYMIGAVIDVNGGLYM